MNRTKKVQRISAYHQCDLDKQERGDVHVLSPFDTRFQRLRHYFRQILTIEKTRYTSQYFRSNASFRREKARHLKTPEYRYIIHPFSAFMRAKQIVVLSCWCLVFFLDPLLGTFFSQIYLNSGGIRMSGLKIIMALLAVLLSVDVIIRFFSGYIEFKTGTVVLDHGLIVKRYLSFYFWIDFIPNAGIIFSWVLNMFPSNVQVAVFMLKCVRILRLNKMLWYFDNFLNIFNMERAPRNLFALGLVGFFTLHWWTCVLYLIPSIRENWNISNNDSWLVALYRKREDNRAWTQGLDNGIGEAFQNYMDFLQIVVSHFFGAGVGSYKSNDHIERLALCGMLMTGMIYNILVLAQVLHIFGTVNISETRFEDRLIQLNNYLSRHEVPSKLKKRIFTYYNVKFNQKFFSEDEISNTLSEHLRMEVILYSCGNLVERVQIFRGLHRAAVGCVLALLKQQIYLPGDVIMASENDYDKGMLFFILYGTCMVQSVSKREACHIEDGNHFGEIKLFERKEEMSMIYTVVALEPVEVYCLTEKDLDYCCRTYPEILGRLEAMSRYRIHLCKLLMAASTDRLAMYQEDIINELRLGKILYPGIRRDAFALKQSVY